jgi:hypothetical protein
MWKLAEWKLRSYVAEPERGARKSKGMAAEQAGGVCASASDFRSVAAFQGEGNGWKETLRISSIPGGMHRLYVKGLANVHKKLLVQAVA